VNGFEFDEDTRGQVTMSVIEAGTNAIQHGHRKDASKPLDVEFRVHPTVLEIAVHDTGTGFNPDDINGDVTTPEHLLDQRGRGLFIMRSCMDRVEYSFDRHGTLCRSVQEPPDEGRQPLTGVLVRILAVDWGERRVGLARQRPERHDRHGLPTLNVRGREDAFGACRRMRAREREADRIVVGLPLLMSGERGEAARSAEAFATSLAERTGLPVETYDERLTSRLSQRRLHEVGRAPRTRAR
jgi:putative transcription antitermination factor YqgF